MDRLFGESLLNAMLCPCHGLYLCRVSDAGHDLHPFRVLSLVWFNIAGFYGPYNPMNVDRLGHNVFSSSCSLRMTVRNAFRSHGNTLQLHGILKRRAERWREVQIPPDLLRALELVHTLCSTLAKAAGKPLWPWSRAIAHRKIARTMAEAGIEGPQACPKGLRHGFGIAAVAASVPLPTIAAALGHANLQTTAVYTSAADLKAWDFLARGPRSRIRHLKAS